MIDPRATSAQFDMMRASIALDVLRLPHHEDEGAELVELRAAAVTTLKAVLDAA